MFTRKEKAIIRYHYRWWKLRFKTDGTVWAKKSLEQPWGVLYFPEDARRHLECVRKQEEK
jgi:hypothetical protein